MCIGSVGCVWFCVVYASRLVQWKCGDERHITCWRYGHAISSARVGCSDATGDEDMETLSCSRVASSRCWAGEWLRVLGALLPVGVGVLEMRGVGRASGDTLCVDIGGLVGPL